MSVDPIADRWEDRPRALPDRPLETTVIARDHARHLQKAEQQLELAASVAAAIGVGAAGALRQRAGAQFHDRLVIGSRLHLPGGGELSESRARRAAVFLERTATNTLCDAAVAAIEGTLAQEAHGPDRETARRIRESAAPDVVAAYEVMRLIRDAHTHRLFLPVWMIDPERRDRVFEIPGVARLDTSGLDGCRSKPEHYGGPVALLALSHWIRVDVLGGKES